MRNLKDKILYLLIVTAGASMLTACSADSAKNSEETAVIDEATVADADAADTTEETTDEDSAGIDEGTATVASAGSADAADGAV